MIFLRCPNPLPRADTCDGEAKEQAIQQIRKKLGLPPAEPPKAVKILNVSNISFCPVLKADIFLSDGQGGQ